MSADNAAFMTNLAQVEKTKLAIAKGFNKAACHYNKNAIIQKQIADEALSRLAAFLDTKVSTLVDLGCGTATASSSLLANAEQLIGIDIAFDMLKMANNSVGEAINYKRFHVLNADAENLPLKNNSIDGIYSSMALQWSNSPAQALAEIQRVLTYKGKALLGILVGESFSQLHNAWKALDKPSRINQFHSRESWLQAAHHLKWQCHFSSQTFTSYHPTILGMLASMKHVGANTQTGNAAKQQIPNFENQVSSLKRFLSKAEINALRQEIEKKQPISVDCSNTSNAPSLMLPLDYEILFLEITNIDS